MSDWLSKVKQSAKGAVDTVTKTATDVSETVKDKMTDKDFFMTFAVSSPTTAVAELDEGLNSLNKEYKDVDIVSMAQFGDSLIVVVKLEK